MALLDPNSYSRDVLVVGDGNFSFSLCLASALSQTSVKIIATSLDSAAGLANNDFAVQNIKKLSAFENVEVLHGVDATDLSRIFGSRIFDRVIFNFPHVGGKSNIGKSRELLKQFFASAAKHVESHKGEICVSLCQGQGGTPLDNSRREHGNTWQVVYQAAKAALILNAVHPFKSRDYDSYQSAGYRGQLGKGFHTVNGLMHVFVHGAPMDPVPDIDFFITNHSSYANHCYPLRSLSSVPDNPVYVMTNKLKRFFSTISVGAAFVFRQLESIDDINEEVKKLNFHDSDGGVQQMNQSFLGGDVSLVSKVLQNLQEFGELFVIGGTELDFFFPPSSANRPICHKMVAVHTSTDDASSLEITAELDRILDLFIKQIMCSGLQGLRIESRCKGVSQEDVSTSDDLVASEVAELKSGRQTRFYNLRNAASAGIGCECGRKHTFKQDKCIFCRLEKHYLGCDISPSLCTTKCFHPSTLKELYHKERLVLSCGLLDANVLCAQTSDNFRGWLMEVNLDNLVMALFGITDIRLLWSQDERFKKQFSNMQEKELQDLTQFVPFSLFPPTYIHDISFWITEQMTEQQFFRNIYETTQECVSDVQFIERYYDSKQDKVSYNYRMVYSSCDRPLTHIQTVEMQNLLRRKLLNFDFQLK